MTPISQTLNVKDKGLSDEETQILGYGTFLKLTVQHSLRDHGLYIVLLSQKGPTYLQLSFITHRTLPQKKLLPPPSSPPPLPPNTSVSHQE